MEMEAVLFRNCGSTHIKGVRLQRVSRTVSTIGRSHLNFFVKARNHTNRHAFKSHSA